MRRRRRRQSEPLLARMNGLIGGGDGERARGLFVIIIGANKRGKKERRGNEEAFHGARIKNC